MEEKGLWALNQVANLEFLEDLYLAYQSSPQKVDPSWQVYFQKLEQEGRLLSSTAVESSSEQVLSKEIRIEHLADAYRHFGHLMADFNPIHLKKNEIPEQLRLGNLGFEPHEMEALFPTHHLLPQKFAPLKEIIGTLEKTYAQSVGFEFKGFVDKEVEKWIQMQIESGRFHAKLSIEEQLAVLDILTRAEVLEAFLHTKHVGKKRFSLEGAETLLPMLVLMGGKAAKDGVEEFVIGMSHRGRLNVLANFLNKPILEILKDFDDDYVPAASEGMGDIRYHKGYASESVELYGSKAIKLTMAPNPSHLESVNPVVEGQVHAKQFLAGDEKERLRIIPLLIHGDASLSGQGVVYETLQMSHLAGFETGGTLHFVINNQIGFTTTPREGRSTMYCTDIAKTFAVPVFHVNAEDPEMCAAISLFALEIRQRFHCDVFIDLYCYRKWGHNEGDEPAFTQPLEYQIIRNKKSIRTQYLEKLLQEGRIREDAANQRFETLKKHLAEAFENFQQRVLKPLDEKADKAILSAASPLASISVDTKASRGVLAEVAAAFCSIPENFELNPKLQKLFKERSQAILEEKPVDWGTAELLAYGTLCCDGVPVRLAGQDSARGTFSHRHALWIDQKNNQTYSPLSHIRGGQERFEVLNTCLSEVAALGFEYGYSTVSLKGLNIWEAQYGDFVNSAQVVIDQYIASGEQKWGQKSNLVLFLPHGLEGQGPEHSSARFERFLSLAGHENIQITYPTAPAQLFHLLRRQVKQPFQKPLVILTPKGLLRHPACVSSVKDLTEGEFYPIIDDPKRPESIQKLIVCSGRIYYDLDERREKLGRKDLAIVRIEQLYPQNIEELKIALFKYGQFQECLWVQEEPENMGAWPYISFLLQKAIPSSIPLRYVGRERSASPATGFYSRHKQEFDTLLQRVFE